MSEPTFPVGPGPASSAGAAETAEAAGNRRALVALAALGGAAVLGIVAYVFLLGGGDEEPAPVVAPPAATSTEDPAADPNAPGDEAEGDGGPRTPAANSVGRNPFEPLVTEQVAAETGTGTPAVDPVTGLPVDPGTTPTDPGTTPTDPGTTPAVPTEATTIRLDKVDATTQTIVATVDGERYTAALGQTFADFFTFVGLRGDGNRALFLYGDITLPLRVGGEATVSPGGK